MVLSIGFWILAMVTVVAALAVVALKDVFRAALSLVMCLAAIAGLYITLSADFLAGAQVVVYVGAISILLILGIMMTREVQQGSPSNKFRVPAFFVALAFFVVMAFVFQNTPWVISNFDTDHSSTGRHTLRPEWIRPDSGNCRGAVISRNYRGNCHGEGEIGK
jgi:NADH-quinone oxidoreductase subunit J